MAPSKSVEREARAARDRLRRYNARQAAHAHKVRRRKRDNLLAIIVALVVIALATTTQVLYFTQGPGVPEPVPTASEAPVEEGQNVGDVPTPGLAEGRPWTGELTLNDVTLGIELDGAGAPQAVASFVQGVQDDYYAGKTCHRLVNDGAWLVQCGSLSGDGATDPSYSFGPIENAPADGVYPAGTIAMARAGDDAYSNGRQFFIIYQDTTLPEDSAGGYTVFGRVTSGLDEFVSQIADKGVTPGPASANDGAPVVPTTITGVTIG